MLDIFQYHDYRQFLKDYFEESKRTCKAFSHQYFAHKAGIRSSGFMLHVIKGQRNLTPNVLHKVAHAVGLGDAQTEYFEILVNFNQAKHQQDRDYYLEKLMEKKRLGNTVRLRDKQLDYYSDWHHSAVREIIPVLGKNAQPATIAKHLIPAISPAKVRSSLKLLEELGLIRKNPEGGWETAIVRFQRQMLGLARESWDNCPAGEAAAHTLTLAMSEKLAKEIREDMELFKKKLIEKVLAEHEPAERLYEVTMNYFPLSRKKKGESL
jgi:uncharacterized protein (TIGR02147 family)